MKRLVIIGLLLLCCGSVWAQKEGKLIGTPVYYDTLGNVIGQRDSADTVYHRPKHHFRNRLENEFCSVFLEGETLLGGNDAAIGAQVAWIPRRWGVYGSGLMGFHHGYFSAGPVLRLSDCGNTLDWHLYGGLVVSRHMGCELGFRMASSNIWGDFCWTSMSVAVGHVNGMNYVTLGFSLTLTSLLAFSIW